MLSRPIEQLRLEFEMLYVRAVECAEGKRNSEALSFLDTLIPYLETLPRSSLQLVTSRQSLNIYFRHKYNTIQTALDICKFCQD